MNIIASQQDFGGQLREWRQRRRMSQLDLALEAEISSRHLSFVETGRSRPSREMVLRLAEGLQLPLRGRNALLLAAGFAPTYSERSFDDPAMDEARQAVQLILDAHAPFPALAVDRHWTMLAFNAVVPKLLGGVAPELLAPPVNVLRLGLHPGGLAPRIANLAEWKRHLIERLKAQIAAGADPLLEALREELEAYPAPASDGPPGPASALFVPMILETEAGRLSFFSTTTVFGTPVEVTLSELALETFFPADPRTAELLRAL